MEEKEKSRIQGGKKDQHRGSQENAGEGRGL